MALYTVFGGKGFIGSAIVNRLQELGHNVSVPERNDTTIFERKLGVVIYAAGYGDCISDPNNVIEANLGLLEKIIRHSDFEKLIYFSSTRVYLNQEKTDETASINICNNDSRRLFNLSKMTAEELCMRSCKKHLIIRPSNVYGLAVNSPLFLPAIVKNAILNKYIDMYVTPEYSKDYVFVDDLVSATLELIDRDIEGIVNVASGENTSAQEIADILQLRTKCKVNWLVDNDLDYFHPINIFKVKSLTNYDPSRVTDKLSEMISDFNLYFDTKIIKE